MKLIVCAVYDAAVKAYLQPFFARSTGEAVRGFSDAVNDPKLQFKAHYADYSLFHVATWDDAVAEFTPAGTAPIRLVAAAQVVIDEALGVPPGMGH